MHRNTEGLKRSALIRSKEAMQRASAALNRMESSDQAINFRTVAAEARVSTAWLYNNHQLRGRIIRLRKSQALNLSPEPPREDCAGLSAKSVVATLRSRIKSLEDKNRKLTERLEQAYGVIAQIGHGVSSTTFG